MANERHAFPVRAPTVRIREPSLFRLRQLKVGPLQLRHERGRSSDTLELINSITLGRGAEF
jgi:hypothetical protein